VCGLFCVFVFVIDLLVVLSVSGGLCWGLEADSALNHY
jgi:hypothetical protein